MAEVPNLAQYIRRVSGGGGGTPGESASVRVNLLGNGYQPFNFAPGGASIEDLNNIYMPQIQTRVGELMAADPELDPNTAAAQAAEEVFADAVFSYEVLFNTMSNELESLGERVATLEAAP